MKEEEDGEHEEIYGNARAVIEDNLMGKGKTISST